MGISLTTADARAIDEPSDAPHHQVAVVPVFAPAAPARRRLGWRIWMIRVALLFLALSTTAVAGHYGFVLRESLWAPLQPLRHEGDAINAFAQGKIVNDMARAIAGGDAAQPVPSSAFIQAYRDRYITAATTPRNGAMYDFDYGPLRLLAVSLWVRNAQQRYPGIQSWRDDFALMRPMLLFNTVCGAAAAIAMFLLVRHWMLRDQQPSQTLLQRLRRAPAPGKFATHQRTVLAWTCGIIGAWLVWFHPTLLLNAHVWPQWDVWVIPFYLLAAWCCSINAWFCAGALIAVGAMLKGQTLLVAPLLVLWPMFDVRPRATARILIGFATFFLGIASIWLIPSATAAWAVVSALIACLLVAPFAFWRRAPWWAYASVAAMVITLLIWPAVGARRGYWILYAIALASAVVAGPLLLPRRSLGVWLAGVLVASVVSSAAIYGGSLAWFEIGFGYGTYHYPFMTVGRTSNLPAMLHEFWRWRINDVVFAIGEERVTVQELLRAIYMILLVICAWAASVHARRNSKRLLIAIMAPWVIAFAILPQMHERYLAWGAVISAVGVGVSLGMTLLHVMLTAIATIILLHNCLQNTGFWPEIHRGVAGTYPSIAWLILLTAAIYLYTILIPRRTSSAQA